MGGERDLPLNAAADLIGMDWHTLRDMVDAGEIPGARVRSARVRTLRFIPISQVRRLRGTIMAAKSPNETK